MKLKHLLLIVIFLFSVFSLNAEGAAITFLWDWNDFDVIGFRYQLDAMEDEGWTEVEYYITSATFEGLDTSLPHVLFVQQTYDGTLWSEASRIEYEPASSADLELDGVFPQGDEGEEADSGAGDAGVPSGTEMADEPAVVENELSIDLSGRLMLKSLLSESTGKSLEAGVSCEIPGLLRAERLEKPLGLRFDLVLDFYPRPPMKVYCFNASLMGFFRAELTERLSIVVPAGVEASFDIRSGEVEFGVGITAGAGLRFVLGRNMHLQFEGLAHLLTTSLSFSAGAVIGFRI